MLRNISAALLVASLFTVPALAASGTSGNAKTANAQASATTNQPASGMTTTAKPAVKKIRHASHHRGHVKMTSNHKKRQPLKQTSTGGSKSGASRTAGKAAPSKSRHS